jgi:MFS family permease
MFGSIDRLTDRVIRRVVLLLLAGCLGLAAIGVALASLYYWLILWMTVPAALLAVALLLTIIALVLARLSAAKPSAKAAAATSQAAAVGPNLMAMASDLAGTAVKADPLGAMLGAGAAGFILETRPDLDHALIQQVLRQFLTRP